jgi:EF-P beta-lysylation protein EpmB
MLEAADYLRDPVGDMESRVAPGILHKYRSRALIVTTGACAVHCRYCFRRHFPYSDESATASQWSTALDYLRGDASIAEVILSGGDPLSLSDARLSRMTDDLQSLPHVRRLRIHTRQPVVLPERVDTGLLAWTASVRVPIVMVLHANHANEIDASVRDACRSLREHNVTLLNQAVLLAGVNDSVDALVALSESLFAAGVLPYYLHALDRVQGAAHFAVSDSLGLELIRQLTARLPGYLVPKFVREIAGAAAKRAVELASE